MGIWLERIKARQTEMTNKTQILTLEETMRRVAELLNGRGWVAIRSPVLGGEIVIWARDGTIAIPARWQGAVKYLVAELNRMADTQDFNEEDLRQVHGVKKTFGGELLSDKDSKEWKDI